MKIDSFIGLKNTWGVVLATAAATVAGAPGCGDGDFLNARLDVAEPAPVSKPSDEEEWLRKQQMVRRSNYDANGNLTWQGDVEPGSLPSNFDAVCAWTSGIPNTCTQALSSKVVSTCRARILLALATPQGDAVTIPVSGGGTIRIDQVSDAAAVELASMAATHARTAVNGALVQLLNPTSNACTDGSGFWQTDGTGRSLGTWFASTAADAYHVALQAFDRAVETTLNTSDKMRSSSLSPTEAAQRATSGSALSRAAAAHLLVGGNAGVDGDTLNALCTSPDLTPQERTALELLRSSGVSPALLATPSIQTLLDSTQVTNPTGGSLRQRLAQFYDIPSLALGGSVSAYYGLADANFENARKYLLQEHAAFSRSRHARLAAIESGYYTRYAATANEPTPLPSSAWATRLGYRTTEPEWQVADSAILHADNLKSFIGTSHIAIRDILKSTSTFAGAADTPSVTRAEVAGGLASLIASNEYRGMMRLKLSSSNLLEAWIYNFTSSDGIRIVVGDDGLRCAVEGTIEGADCSDAVGTEGLARYPCATTEFEAKPTLSCLTVMALTSGGSTVNYGSSQYASNSKSLGTNSVFADKTRFYFVQPKTPTSPVRPGYFEVLGGITVHTPGNSSFSPIVPTVDQRVEKVFAPSRKFCSVPETSCVGVKVDARLPLEDELTDDGNEVESSWQHYLTLAKQAAEETEFYGREYANAAVAVTSAGVEKEIRQEEQRQRADDLLQGVQSSCGTAIDPRTLLNSLSSTNTSKNLSSMFVTSGTCGSGYFSVPGGCVVNFGDLLSLIPASSDADRLRTCLLGASEPFVTLGDQQLCLGIDAAHPNHVCPPAPIGSSWQCPTRKIDHDPPVCPTPPNGISPAFASPLSYFKDDGGPVSVGGACGALRRARARSETSLSDIDYLKRANALHPIRLGEKVQNIQWEAKYGAHSTIKVNGIDRYSTGDIQTGPSTTWPCAAVPGCAGDTSGSMFCQPANCSSPVSRGAMNYRLLKAASIAQVLLGKSNETVHAVMPSAPVFSMAYSTPNANGTHTWETSFEADPCSHDQFFVDVPNSDKLSIAFQSSTELLWEGGMTPIRACKATPLALFEYYSAIGHLPRSLDTDLTYYVYERQSGAESPGTAWVDIDGNVVQSYSGSRFMIKGTPLLAIVDIEDEVARQNAYLGGLSQAVAAPPFWMLEVLQGIKPINSLPESWLWLTDTTWEDSNLRGAYYLGPSNDPISMLEANASDVLDAMELLCELSSSSSPQSSLAAAVTLESIEQAALALREAADGIVERASMTFFPRVPKFALDALRQRSTSGTAPLVGGRMQEEVSRLKKAMVDAAEAAPIIANSLRQLSDQMIAYRYQVEIAAQQEEAIDLSTLSANLDRVTQCAASMNAVEMTTGFGTVATCANAGAQIAIAMKNSFVQKTIVGLELSIARQGFMGQIDAIATSLSTESLRLITAFEDIDTATSNIETLRKQAQISISRALHLISFQSDKQIEYEKGLGTIASSHQRRYEQSLINAKLMAFYAKRAIEQRLGISLREMREDLPLVEAPASWEGEVCTHSGMPQAAEQGDLTAYVGGFIGDYVKKLENVVESYRIENQFHEGTDTAIVSLRDDIFRVRRECQVPSKNLLRTAAQLSAGPWIATDCTPVTVGAETMTAHECITAQKMPEAAVWGVSQFGTAPGYKLKFGNGTSTCLSSTCGWHPSAFYAQSVLLTGGRYRLTWYTKETGANGGAKAGFAQVKPRNGASPIIAWSQTSPPNSPTPVWQRAKVDFEIAETALEGEYEVGFGLNQPMVPTGTVTVGAPMLERLPSSDTPLILGSFQNTDASGLMSARVCEDTDGSEFRGRKWRRNCIHLCESGLSDNCTDGPEYCYHEASFSISQAAIEEGKLFNYSGFARGNFNYRIDTLGLNFVGSGVRDCADSTLPNTCYSGGFVPYSIEHNGPFFVRTHDGRDFRSYLFDGRIEHGRGLAAERYLTNPISTTDRELLQDFMREELQGRPLDGNFIVRVWDEPGVNFQAIEDIQLIINYSYWTRFE